MSDLGILSSDTSLAGQLPGSGIRDDYFFTLDNSNSLNLNLSFNGIPDSSQNSVTTIIYEDLNGNSSYNLGEEIELLLTSANETTSTGFLDLTAGDYGISLLSIRDDPTNYEINLDVESGTSTSVGTGNINPFDPSNIERYFGTSLIGEQAAVETGNINDSNPSDAYSLSVVPGAIINISLSGLSNDADLRVVRDLNFNNIIDDGEIYATSESSGTGSENILMNLEGDNFVEVYQYEGSTDYTLQFDQEFTGGDIGGGATAGDVVYRFFETNGQTQFYTTSEIERDSVITNLANYEYEGESFIGAPNPEENDITGVTPVYRLFNTSTGVHLYTASEVERDFVVANLSNYTPEGISYYGYESQQEGTVPLYRFYNQSLDAHFYTPSIEERNEFIASPEYQPDGNDSGIAFYVQPVDI
ncbi:MAG: hypothetical protein ACFCAD_20040 [Pleurocapsa sp.]